MKIFKWIGLVVVLLFMGRELMAQSEIAGKDQDENVLKERVAVNQQKANSKNIYKASMRNGVVYRIQTALGYVSTIDLPEEALKVFVGDQDLFKVGVYERQVLIKPLTDDLRARTNLIIVTESSRLTFDILVGEPETADFVIDFRLPETEEMLVENAFKQKVEEKTEAVKKDFEQKKEGLQKEAEKLSEEKLKEDISKESKQITLKVSRTKEDVQVNLLSISRIGDRGYLRFSVLNISKSPFKVLKVLLGAKTRDGFLNKEESGLVEIPSDLKLDSVIESNQYVHGVLSFEYRDLAKNEKPVFKLFEEAGSRVIEISGFNWVRS